MSIQRVFLKNTQTNQGTGGTTYDLSKVQGTGAVLTSPNRTSTTYILAYQFQITVSNIIRSVSFPTSIRISAASNTSGLRWRLDRYNSSNVLQASSTFQTVTGITLPSTRTAIITFSTTWSSGDRLRLRLETNRSSGGGNANLTFAVNDASSYVDYDYRRIFAVS